MVVRAPSISTAALALLLLFQAAIYANAVWAGAWAEGIHLTPLRRAYRNSAQSTGARPGSERLAMPAAIGAVAVVLMLLISPAAAPAPPESQPTAPGADQAADAHSTPSLS